MTSLTIAKTATSAAMALCTELAVGSAWQSICVASLIGHCEAVVASGLLPQPAEQSLRFLIAETLSAFNMASHDQLENEVAAVRRCMERV